MYRNIDVVNSLFKIANIVNAYECEIDTICEEGKISIFEILENPSSGLIALLKDEFKKTEILIEMLSIDFRNKLYENGIELNDFLVNLEQAIFFDEKLCENWEILMEYFGMLGGFCEDEVNEYKQLTQFAYVDDLVDVLVNK